jgi:hypothetical protein
VARKRRAVLVYLVAILKSMSNEQRSYSIRLRLRRTIIQDAYVSVPVTDAVTRQDEDGEWRVDGEAVFAAGVELGNDARVEWKTEEETTEAHPMQTRMPDDRFCFSPALLDERTPD